MARSIICSAAATAIDRTVACWTDYVFSVKQPRTVAICCCLEASHAPRLHLVGDLKIPTSAVLFIKLLLFVLWVDR